MYSRVELPLMPSEGWGQLHVTVLTLLFFIPFTTPPNNWWLFVPLWSYLIFWGWRYRQGRHHFQQPAFWLYQNGRWFRGMSLDDVAEVGRFEVKRLLPQIVCIQYRLNGKTKQDWILPDRVQAEAFRQFRVVLKLDGSAAKE